MTDIAAKQADIPLESSGLSSKRASAIKLQNRVERFRQVHRLHRQCVSQRNIAKALSIHRETVGRYLRSADYAERATGLRSSGITPYVAYLHKRWQEGCQVRKVLFQELQQQGFRQSIYTLYRFLAQWQPPSKNNAPPVAPPSFTTPSSKLVAIWALKHSKNLAKQDQAFITQLAQENDELKESIKLAQQFAHLMRNKQVSEFSHWLKTVDEAKNQPELKRYAKGLRDDLAAVGAAIALPWSNGQLEGQVNRLKLIKRQMYGRGNFDLLRCRFLGAA